ncbi:endolytic transglycosylase MltG [Pseudazoarcus pumilus]|uniref:Endolytic murein transglycosylase n=1 Tax=Pseudazoarcus pumilus TaxID=2067960 RepID=A0A2I6SAT1_9RHOO|nr:endolytic transglycosylase MltG [Pseudazoarcus pumilus]AUN96345.1 endolytic transglycosylase MltG [Pseudazoarcus pumilus]
MKSWFVRFLLLATALAALAAAWAAWSVHRPLALAAPADFIVERGQTMRAALREAAAAGAPLDADRLYWIARATGRAERVVAGGYEVSDGMTPWQLVDRLNRGEVAHAELRLVEGWNVRQVRATIEGHPHLVQDTADLSDEALLARIGADEAHPEGLFFPDTYRFARRSNASALYRAAYEAMQRELASAWAQRDPDLPLDSPYEALILASIIEKETGRADERELVASVFANRLRIGMRLQTDPTVIYGYGESFEGRLRRRHLDTDHEYNTYTRGGLPPTPIAMPGRAALLAAVQPAESDYLYFVARGDGTSKFSRTLREHNRAVNIHILGRDG